MKLHCQVCGQAVELPSWSEDYEKYKASEAHPFICEPCQERIRTEAAKDQKR